MSCIIPPVLQNPMLHNAIVSNIQTDLDGMGWIDKIYPLAEVGQKLIGETETIVPIIYGQENNNDYIEMFPDDNERAGCFFELPNGDYNFDFVNDSVNYQMSIIVWANLKNLASRTYDFTDELIASTIIALKDGYYKNDITNIVVSKDKNIIFNKYGYDYNTLKEFMYPNTAFKITFTMNIEDDIDCLTAGSFDPSFSPVC